jgi:hypothetical protein
VTLEFNHPPSLEATGLVKGQEEVSRKVPILFLRSGHVDARSQPSKAAHVDARSQPSRLAVVGLHCHPLSIKVSITKISSSLRCRRANPHQKPWTTTLVEASPASSDGNAVGRPVLRHRRLMIYSQSSISWPLVQIRLGVPLRSDWIPALDQEANDHHLMKVHGPMDRPLWTRSTDRGPIPPIFQ